MDRKSFLRDAFFHLFLVTGIILIDQLTKLWARTALSKSPVVLWKGVFSFRLVYNTGGPWGMLGTKTVLLTILSVIIMIGVVVLYFYMPKVKKLNYLRICVCLIFAGAFGNLIDRIFAQKVTDLISFDLIDFPVFNVADMSVVCGCILAFILTIFYYKDEDFQWKK